MNLINGGDLETHDLEYCFYMLLPEISVNEDITTFTGNKQKITSILFTNCFLLTRGEKYYNISLQVLGFGLGLTLEWR